MNKPKQQGTAHETWIVTQFKLVGLWAQRLAEGGINDRGDITSTDTYGWDWTYEAKATERLNVTRELAKARSKATRPVHTALIWKRLVKTGKKVRQPDGEPVVVVVAWDTWLELLTRR